MRKKEQRQKEGKQLKKKGTSQKDRDEGRK